jgi:zinc transporter
MTDEPEAHVESIDHAYGSNRHGLVWGYRFADEQPAQPFDTELFTEQLASATPGAADFLWLHFSLANAASESWMRQHLELPDVFYDSLHEDVGSTRLEQEDDALVAVMHDVLFDFTFDASSISTVHLCIRPGLMVSARLRPLRSVDRLRTAIKRGQVFRSSAELLAQLLQDQAAVLVSIVRQSTTRVNQIEDKVLANQIASSRRELGTLRRMLVRLQRLLAPEPAAMFRLLSRPLPWITSADLQELHQAAEEFSTAIVDSAALIERVKLLQEELAALINEQTSRTLYVLTVVTVLALPINLIAGLFGMNVGGIPLSDHSQGFFLIIGALAIFTSVMVYLAFGRRNE